MKAAGIFKFSNCLIVSLLFFSCGNNHSEKQSAVLNDSIPADLASINARIGKDRSNTDLYYQRARYYFSKKDFENAINDMKIVLKFDSTKSGYYLFLSDLYLTQNKTRDTRDMLRKAMRLDSSNTEALRKYSELFYLMKQYDTAMYYINRSLHYDRAFASAHFQKGMILKETGDTARAISCFQDAVKANQQYYGAYIQLGILFSVRNNPLALEYLKNALNLEPTSVEALYLLGSFYQNTGRYDEAIAAYDTLLKYSPENQDATFNKGAVLFEQKKFNDAMNQFDLTVKRDENFFRGYYGKGRCYEALGDKKMAIENYRHCLSLKPNYDLAAVQLDLLDKKGARPAVP